MSDYYSLNYPTSHQPTGIGRYGSCLAALPTNKVTADNSSIQALTTSPFAQLNQSVGLPTHGYYRSAKLTHYNMKADKQHQIVTKNSITWNLFLHGLRDKQHLISCGDNFHKLYLPALIDSIPMIFIHRVWGFGVWLVRCK